MAETIVSDKLLVAKEKMVFGKVCKPILCIVKIIILSTNEF